jgi:hypothetical protein
MNLVNILFDDVLLKKYPLMDSQMITRHNKRQVNTYLNKLK